ncbi:helix-turn-helix domain-containing protein [Nostoc parmelioides]|uniref:Helix-turn-helix domain-containing protein n=1 Tax=Nostoc parmelioides FACHB-3921 TaxID=2692909 RepID=A0ABR8BIZ9_9NOSO|nr:helix-turn-helix domain-containing protein [Nostoc parmelioides]MBD2253831.1 helix-turn-helix domain-containing protein [Nostoc parmelioides FACHB-3921]
MLDIIINNDNITINNNIYFSKNLSGSKADLILHPVRLKILQAFVGDRHLSARQLCEILPDIPQATLYRHFQKLVQAELLTVVAEHPIRGTVEKFYSLQEQNTELLPEELAALTGADHQRHFTAFVVSLLTEFEAYLQRDEIDLVKDGVGYRQIALHLSDEELAELTQSLNQVLVKFLHQKPSKQRKRFLLSSILIPGD